ncbi:hypothetical protein BDV95DRAFT_561196 [Massariosphaeria phaeospora]|uniref:Rhodopsin domain-containing protein n=1 Tax=Massariosphaeria phaeospora TaxID=100035 RepID=A0A7C8IGI5_9PLEO|nr:hypothetical protein BDV95DRAFT_561196 [Massariosphaeria phaeospora]
MFVKPVGRGIVLLVVISVLHPLSTIALVLRLYARYLIRAIGLDDYLMVLGWAVQIASVTCTYISVANGGGTHHLIDIQDPYKSMMTVKWNLIALFLYTTATAPIKSSICVLLLRITPSSIYRWILYSLIFICVVSSIVAIVVFATICAPVSAVWDGEGRCEPSDYQKFAITIRVFGAFSILTDWSCALIPIPILWNVQLTRRTKVYIAGMLALGVFASVGTIVRMYALNQRVASDHVYSIIHVATWSNVECNFGIIGGCLATMRPLLRRLGVQSSGISGSGAMPNSHQLHPINQARRTDISKLDDMYQVIIESEGRGKGEEDTSDSGSQRRILANSGLQIYKESDVNVRTERGDVRVLNSFTMAQGRA